MNWLYLIKQHFSASLFAVVLRITSLYFISFMKYIVLISNCWNLQAILSNWLHCTGIVHKQPKKTAASTHWNHWVQFERNRRYLASTFKSNFILFIDGAIFRSFFRKYCPKYCTNWRLDSEAIIPSFLPNARKTRPNVLVRIWSVHLTANCFEIADISKKWSICH